MKIIQNRILSLLCVLVLSTGARAGFIENFDNLTNPFTLTNSSGGAPSIQSDGNASGNFVRIVNASESNNNSIAWDEDPSQTGPAPAGLRLSFDLRMSGTADGIGFGMFDTSTYGATGGANPATMGQGSGDWERPAFNDAFTVGFDVYNMIDEVNLNWAGVQFANADVQPFMDLNDGKFHRALVTIKPDGANALVDMTILEDIQGSTVIHPVFSDEQAVGLDLANLPAYRLIGGGRTGGEFLDGDFDNIALSAIPEPSSALLFLSGLLMLVARRRVR